MSAAVKALRLIFSVYGFIIFLTLMLILLPAVVIASFFGQVKGGNAIYRICRLWADLGFFLWGIRHRNIFSTPHDRSRPMVFVFNHVSYMDIPVLMKTFRRQPVRILGKAEMASIPVFGFIYRKATIMVDRKNPEARAKSIIHMIDMLRQNISVIIAPEGTFNTSGKPLKDFYNGAFRIAIETGTPIKPVIILDSFERLNYNNIFSLTPGKSRSVFLEEVPVDGLGRDDVDRLKSKVYSMMEAALIQYQAKWIIKK